MNSNKAELALDEEGPSKSQLKRDAEALQNLGVRMSQLKPKQLASLELDDVLVKAIEDYIKLPNSYAARKRHAQYIGKLMRGRDYPALLRAVEELENPRSTARPGSAAKPVSPTARACAKLLADVATTEEQITLLIEEHSKLERQTLRQLCRSILLAAKKQDSAAEKRARNKLSHYVSQHIN